MTQGTSLFLSVEIFHQHNSIRTIKSCSVFTANKHFFQKEVNLPATDTTLHQMPLTGAIAIRVLYSNVVEPLGRDTEKENPAVTGTKYTFCLTTKCSFYVPTVLVKCFMAECCWPTYMVFGFEVICHLGKITIIRKMA